MSPASCITHCEITGFFVTEADDYSSNGSADAVFRVLLVSRVVVGKALKRRVNASDLTELPCGYHSVREDICEHGDIDSTILQLIGEPGEDLNFQEHVVYTNDAIRPAYLVVYGHVPEDDSKLKAMISTLFKTPIAS
jgi:hypothetical protein